MAWLGAMHVSNHTTTHSTLFQYTLILQKNPHAAKVFMSLPVASTMTVCESENLHIKTTAKMIAPDQLSYTPLESIPKVADPLRATFMSQKTRPAEYRLKQLKRLYWAIKDNSQAIYDALQSDLAKPAPETYISEIGWCLNDIVFMCNNLKKWMKATPAPDMSMMNMPLRPKIRKEPLGVVLIIGTYNFPIQLTLGPLIGAISAGCPAVVKPSESAPAAAVVVERIIKTALDPAAYAVVQGGVSETTALLDIKWDKIFYTGGAAVAKIVAKKAAETLTPVTLELGGKNAAIVTKNADVKLAAKRLLWGKTFNAGQVCTSQNYTLVEESILPQFISEMKSALKEFYPEGVRASPDYGRIIHTRQFNRLVKMLEDSKGQILAGGDHDVNELFIAPTIVQVSSADDSLIAEESFGPLLPLLPFKDLNKAIGIINDVSGTPLGLYPFGDKQEIQRILDGTRSGGSTVNDAFFHASIHNLAFGGVGDSGQGAYRGKASFDCFTHERSVVATPGWMETLLQARYPPFAGTNKLATVKRFQDLKPNFGREVLN